MMVDGPQAALAAAGTRSIRDHGHCSHPVTVTSGGGGGGGSPRAALRGSSHRRT